MRVVIILVALVTVGAVYSVYDSSAPDGFSASAWRGLGAEAAADDGTSTPASTSPTTTSTTATTTTTTQPGPVVVAGAADEPPTTEPDPSETPTPTTVSFAGPGCVVDPATPTGRLAPVPAPAAAATAGSTPYVVELEEGLGIDGDCFIDAVASVLGDERGWASSETGRFRRVTSGGAFTVTLASPDTVDRLCAPLRTDGYASCWNGSRAMINLDRWLGGTDEFTDLETYRAHVINHHVGRALGKSPVGCPAEGEPAPVMQQQTVGVAPCTPNAWPLDSER